MSNIQNKDYRFVSFLQENAEDRAMLAALRRGLGQEPGQVIGMYPYVERREFAPNRYEAEFYYMVAALFALHPVSAECGNMGTHLRAYAGATDNYEATERRFVRLLRMRRESMEPHLRQHISMLKSKDIKVNWHELITDLRFWNYDERRVQRRWARAFWGSAQSNSETE